MKRIREILKLSPLLLIFLLLSINLVRPSEFVEIMLLFTPFLLLSTFYLFGEKKDFCQIKNGPRALPTLLLLQLFIFLASTFFTTNTIQSIYSLMRWVSIIITIIILSGGIRSSTSKTLSIFVQSLGLIYSLIFLTTLIFKIAPPNFLSTIKHTSGHNQLASILIISIPLAFSNLFSKSTDRSTLKFSRVVLVINLFALVFTLARGAWLALLFIFPLIIAIKKKSVVLLHKHKTFVISISLLVSVVVFLGVINDLNYTNNTNLTTRTLTNIHQQPLNFKARLGYYSRALSRFKHRLPWGTGLNTYTNSQSKVSHSNGITSYVHSFLLQILTETGIFSALSFLIILTYITRQLFVAARNSSDTTISGVFYAFTLSLIYSFYDFNLNTSLVFLTIFSLAISVIYDPRQKKVSPLERTGQTINFLVIFYLFLLLSFIVLGLYSTMISTKADKLVLNENHQEAYKLYLNSMKIFPYSNSNFEKTILYLDDYFPEKSHSLIQKWIRLNNNNGAMYTFLANRSLDSLDLNTSLEYMNISLSSGYEPSPSSETVKLALKFISHSSKTTLDPQIVRFIHLLNNFSLNHPVKYLDWEISEFYYQATLHLVYNLSFDTLIIQDKKIILESALDGFFILDINENAHIINLLDRLIILNSNNQLYSQYKNILVSLSYSETSLQTIDQLISNLKPNIKASHLPQVSNVLLSHLYISKSKYYQSDNTVEELEYIDKAIQASPFTSSFRIYKAARLKDLGLMKESKNALEECVVKISPECEHWYLNSSQDTNLSL